MPVIDRKTLSRIDEQLGSSEVAALCFLCRDVVTAKRLEGIGNAHKLFLRLEEKGLLENDYFLCQLLQTIRRADLLNLLETDSRRPEETDANPTLSEYRVMLYKVYEDMTKENLNQMKFLLSNSESSSSSSKLTTSKLETCNTALDVFAEMEKTGLLSNNNLQQLHTTLLELDQQLASIVQRHMQGATRSPPHVSMDYQRGNNTPQQTQPTDVSICETQPRNRIESVCSDAEPKTEPSSPPDHREYYTLDHNPHGLCVVINNEEFPGTGLTRRAGTQEDAKALRTVFTRLGFTVVVHNNLTAADIRLELKKLSSRNFMDEDALVVCVLSHGEKECVFGTDEQKVFLRELTQPFSSGQAPTLAGKPKLFFIQACQGSDYQRGSVPCPPRPELEEGDRQSRLEEDAGRVCGETVPWAADVLMGMATVQECKSFRNTSTGSIYIQQLCMQLTRSAESSEMDDILTVLTRVNREVSRGDYLRHKQMPQPNYTLTKKLVLRFVS